MLNVSVFKHLFVFLKRLKSPKFSSEIMYETSLGDNRFWKICVLEETKFFKIVDWKGFQKWFINECIELFWKISLRVLDEQYILKQFRNCS